MSQPRTMEEAIAKWNDAKERARRARNAQEHVPGDSTNHPIPPRRNRTRAGLGAPILPSEFTRLTEL